MHTTTIDVDDQEWHIKHNGDYSGDVIIVWPYVTEQGFEATVPFELLKKFVAEYVRDRQISLLENMAADEVLDF